MEDLQRGRATEIDDLPGVITEIAGRRELLRGLEDVFYFLRRLDVAGATQIAHGIVTLIRNAEAAGKGSPGLTPEQIRSASALQMPEYR